MEIIECGIRSCNTTIINEPPVMARSGPSIISNLSKRKYPPKAPIRIVIDVMKFINNDFLILNPACFNTKNSEISWTI